jgi:hypothetical protein
MWEKRGGPFWIDSQGSSYTLPTVKQRPFLWLHLVCFLALSSVSSLPVSQEKKKKKEQLQNFFSDWFKPNNIPPPFLFLNSSLLVFFFIVFYFIFSLSPGPFSFSFFTADCLSCPHPLIISFLYIFFLIPNGHTNPSTRATGGKSKETGWDPWRKPLRNFRFHFFRCHVKSEIKRASILGTLLYDMGGFLYV